MLSTAVIRMLTLLLCAQLGLCYVKDLTDAILQKQVTLIESKCPAAVINVKAIGKLRAMIQDNNLKECKGTLYAAIGANMLLERRYEESLSVFHASEDAHQNVQPQYLQIVLLLAHQGAGHHEFVSRQVHKTDCCYQQAALALHSSLMTNNIDNVIKYASLLRQLFTSIPADEQHLFEAVLKAAGITDVRLFGIHLATGSTTDINHFNDYIPDAAAAAVNIGITDPYKSILPSILSNFNRWGVSSPPLAEIFQNPVQYLATLFCVFSLSEWMMLFADDHIEASVSESSLCGSELSIVLQKLRVFGSKTVVERVQGICSVSHTNMGMCSLHGWHLGSVCDDDPHVYIRDDYQESPKKKTSKKKSRREDVISPSKKLHKTDSTGWLLTEYGRLWSGCEIQSNNTVALASLEVPILIPKGAEKIQKPKQSYVSKKTFRRRYSHLPGVGDNVITGVQFDSDPAIISQPIGSPITPYPDIFEGGFDGIKRELQVEHCTPNSTSLVFSSNGTLVFVMPHGRKLWFFTPPSSSVSHPVSVSALPPPYKLGLDLTPVPPAYCVQEAGDVVILPPYWLASFVCLWEGVSMTYIV
eukprot:TRINITY_DN20951_c0_g1_i1.p1 TRINITY_DN20951_c0_g1~~TRINITY_DN20951_c0_g1_i1.p1  ORF type:complete len:585 (+),score=77.85 TRINITY_DN20951_c0_g1_i1:97-1851(+)